MSGQFPDQAHFYLPPLPLVPDTTISSCYLLGACRCPGILLCRQGNDLALQLLTVRQLVVIRAFRAS